MENKRLIISVGSPATGSGGGAVDSVNGKTGVVVLDGTDVELINGGGVSVTQAISDLDATTVKGVTAGSNVEVNNSNPQTPIVSAFPTTTAGILSRTYFTGDTETLAAGTFYKSNRDGKGTVGTVTQTVNVNDNEKAFFAQDLISEPYPIDTTIYAGAYSGILNGFVSSNGGEQRFTVEIYKTDLDGNPVPSGIAGAPTGDLGVTVIAIAQSGLIDLQSGNESQFAITAELEADLSLLTTNRVRYHVSAEKVGTTGGAIDISTSYGNTHIAHLDIPVQSLTSTTINDDPTEFSGLATQYDINRSFLSSSQSTSNTITFLKVNGAYFGTHSTPLTGTLTYDDTNAKTGAISVIYYNSSTFTPPTNTIFTQGTFVPNEINKIYIERDSEGFYSINIVNAGVTPIQYYYLSPNSSDEVTATITGFSGLGAGEYVEFKARFSDVTKQSPILGSGTSTNEYLTQYLAGQSLMRSTAASAGVVGTGASANNIWEVWRLTNTGTDLTLNVGGNEITGIALNTLPNFNQLFTRGNPNTETGTPTRFADCDFEYIDFNGDILQFTNTTSNHISASGNIAINISSISGVDVATLFTQI